MEIESNTVHLDPAVFPILSHQYMSSFLSTPQGELDASADCNTEEMLVPLLDKTDNDVLKDLIGKDNEFLDSFTSGIGEDVRVFKNDDHNDSGKAGRLDNSSFGVEDSYQHRTPSPTLQRIQHEMEIQVKDATELDNELDNELIREVDNSRIQVQTNQMQVVKEAAPPSSLSRNDIIQSTVYLQDVPQETIAGTKYDQEANNGGSTDESIFESVNTQDECENESIDSAEILSGTNNIQNDENSLFKTTDAFQSCNSTHKDKKLDEKLQSCKVCGKKYRKKYIRTHELIHTDEKPYACEVCNKRYPSKHSLKLHLKIHTGEKSYACETCNKSFLRKTDMKVHTRIHTDERPYKCGVCDKSFGQLSSLTAHKTIHIDEKPHSCNRCDKSFRRKVELLRHSNTHILRAKTIFVCNVCQKAFTQLKGLLYHSHIHTAEKYHPCQVCGKSFAKRKALLRHSRTHTNKKTRLEGAYT